MHGYMQHETNWDVLPLADTVESFLSPLGVLACSSSISSSSVSYLATKYSLVLSCGESLLLLCKPNADVIDADVFSRPAKKKPCFWSWPSWLPESNGFILFSTEVAVDVMDEENVGESSAFKPVGSSFSWVARSPINDLLDNWLGNDFIIDLAFFCDSDRKNFAGFSVFFAVLLLKNNNNNNIK